MPIREYVCRACGEKLERLQRLADDPLTDCPACGDAALEKKISAVGFRLAGGGWYETDFKADDQRRNISGDRDSASDASKTQSGETDQANDQSASKDSNGGEAGGAKSDPAAGSESTSKTGDSQTSKNGMNKKGKDATSADKTKGTPSKTGAGSSVKTT